MAQTPQTVQYSRLSREQAQQALTVLGIQIATHALTCGVCWRAQEAKKHRATSWALYVSCESMRGMRRTESALQHRLRYLLNQEVKRVAAAHEPPLSPWAYQRECPDEYRAIVRHFGLE